MGDHKRHLYLRDLRGQRLGDAAAVQSEQPVDVLFFDEALQLADRCVCIRFGISRDYFNVLTVDSAIVIDLVDSQFVPSSRFLAVERSES